MYLYSSILKRQRSIKMYHLFGEYGPWEEKVAPILRRAHELCPDEPIYAYSYLGSLSNTYGTNGN